ncbi:MAG: site-specific tyrosine recombinase/integron integrase [Thermodesulfobacteriota bacterium]|nr:site-specific tyrosine recombinase/integron integrase [Thermodesulfobacteriota bacterium]
MLSEYYIETLSAEKGYSHHTLIAYRADISGFMKYCLSGYEDHSDLDNFFLSLVKKEKKSLIRSHMFHLYKSGLKKKTCSRKLSAVKSFFDFLVKSGSIDFNPADAVPSPKIKRAVPGFLTIDDVFRLLDSIKTGTLLEKRNCAVFETFYATGLRVSEMAFLDAEDIDFEQKLVKVTGKGNKQRIVPLGKRAADLIKNYRQAMGSFYKPLFLNKNKTRLSDRSMRRILSTLVDECGLNVPVSPHTLRHSFATHMLDSGADLRGIQEILGHATLSTTQIYTHLTTDRLMQVYDTAHPRS